MLEFLLQHNPKSKTLTMNGGPLTRTWTEKEWQTWLEVQAQPGTKAWYEAWAEEARLHPYEDISRQLG